MQTKLDFPRMIRTIEKLNRNGFSISSTRINEHDIVCCFSAFENRVHFVSKMKDGYLYIPRVGFKGIHYLTKYDLKLNNFSLLK